MRDASKSSGKDRDDTNTEQQKRQKQQTPKAMMLLKRIHLLYVNFFAAIVHLVLDNDADSFEDVDMFVGVVVEGVQQGLEEF